MRLLQNNINTQWECFIVYGHAHHDESANFLRDLDVKICRTNVPFLIGGDFNLIRAMGDKNNDNIDVGLMTLFNDFIDFHQLRELVRSGERYTWTNKQLNPIMSVLDRVLVSTEWESLSPWTM
jgi:hypothetical protein